MRIRLEVQEMSWKVTAVVVRRSSEADTVTNKRPFMPAKQARGNSAGVEDSDDVQYIDVRVILDPSDFVEPWSESDRCKRGGKSSGDKQKQHNNSIISQKQVNKKLLQCRNRFLGAMRCKGTQSESDRC